MELPEYVQTCLSMLEKAGFAAYCVGGCVRDALLGLVPHDYDLCTDAKPEEIQKVFAAYQQVLSGIKHGTVSVVTTGGLVEITTFRKEGSYSDNRRPDWVQFVTDIRDDLSRRDFTVNAMAFGPNAGLVDPFGGAQDLQTKTLRCVGDPETRFREDALRIIRGVRFSLRYGMHPEERTEEAMLRLSPLMENLARERVFDELNRLLLCANAEGLCRFAPILAAVIPELGPTVGFNQHSPHHSFDLFTHIAHVTESVPPTPNLRWAALLHDVGKVPVFSTDENGRGHFLGHAKVGAKMADEIMHRLKAPSALRERVVFLIERHMERLEPDEKLLRRRLSGYGSEAVLELLELQKADMGSKGTGQAEDPMLEKSGELIAEILKRDDCLSLKQLAVNGNDLQSLGYKGKAIGAELQYLLAEVVEERLPNTRGVLLETAEKNKLP